MIHIIIGVFMRFILSFSVLLGVILSAPFSFAQSPNNVSPSFDCAKATSPMEKKICSNKNYAKYDVVINQLYQKAKLSAFATGPSNQLKQQREWVKGRDTCLKSVGDVDNCLEYSFKERIIELSVADLFTDFDYSIAQIEKLQPNSAPFYRAIHEYISQEQSKDRDTQIVNWLQPYYEKLQKEYEYPASILTDLEINKISDTISSDKSFGTSIAILGIALDEQLIMPCTALFKKPELISSMSAYFGSSYDGQLIRNDCYATLPPLPNLSNLNSKIMKAMPQCEGTIRFAIYRDNSKTLDEIMLAQFDALLDKDSKSKTISSDTAKLIKSNNTLYKATIDELSYYYLQYFPFSEITKSQIGLILKNYAEDNINGC